MYNREALEKKTVRDLRVHCRRLGIIVTTKFKKSELIDELLEYRDRFFPKEEKKNDEVPMSVRVKRIKEQNDGLE
jgi:hypothetical protein